MDDGSGDRIMPPGKFDLTDDAYADPRALGLEASLQPFSEHTSSQRGTMFAAHIQQHVVVTGNEMPIIATGKEAHFGKYDFNTFGYKDMLIEAVIPKFKTNRRIIRESPSYLVVFRDLTDPKNQILDCYELSQYTACSSGFGYKNRILNPKLLRAGSYISKDTPILVSHTRKGFIQDEDGILKGGYEYAMGVNANVAFVTDPSATTDAVVISDRLANKLSHLSIEDCTIDLSTDEIPLNLYGDEDNHYCFPNIGDKINQYGVLMGVRSCTIENIFDLTPEALLTPNWDSDRLYRGQPGASVIDVQVYTKYSRIAKCRRDRNMVFEQMFDYQDQHYQYYQEVVNTYNKLKELGIPLSPRYNQTVTRCMELLKTKATFSGYKLFNRKNKEPVDFMTLKITYAWERKISVGFKSTGREGAKAVNACIRPIEDMYTDDYGYAADLILSLESMYNRMNLSQGFEQYLGRGCMMMSDRVRQGVYGTDPIAIFNTLIEFLNDIRPLYAELIKVTFSTDEHKSAFVEAVKREGLRLVISAFTIKNMEDVVYTLYTKWKIDKTCCNFVIQENGKRVALRTKSPIMIGPKYIYLLGKLPHQSLISAEYGHVSQFELPIKLSNDLKKQSPFSETPLRLGEDEYAILAMCIGPIAAARLMGVYTSSIKAIELLQEQLFTNPKPSAIEDVGMTTDEIIADSKSVNILTHMFEAAGIGIPTPEVWERYRTVSAGHGEV